VTGKLGRRFAALALAVLGGAALVDRVLGPRLPGGARPWRDPIRSLVVVDAPLETVWRAVSDIPSQPLWMREMKSVRLTTPGPVGVGTRGEAHVRILGVGVRDPVEVAAWRPPTLFAIRHLGSFRGGGEIQLAPGADGTTTIVIWDERLVPPFLPELGAVLGRPVLRRIFQDDLLRFGRLVEAGVLPASAGSSPVG